MSLAFFTSAVGNYLAKAAVLAESVRQHHNGARFYLLLSEPEAPDWKRFAGLFDRLFLIRDLEMPVENVESWIFQHTLVELCTAVKGPFLVHALEELRAEKVVYLDPDIVVFDRFREVETLLDKHSIVATPHLLEPEEGGRGVEENEVCALQHGAFNLGFLAVNGSSEGRRFARWWRDRLLHFCHDDIPYGLFTDQRWMDLAPGFFPGFHILRDTTYNVAPWNVSRRKIAKGPGGRYLTDGSPIKFFHFSGIDAGNDFAMFESYARHSPAVFELRKWYLQELDRMGQAEFGRLPWGYGSFSNGKPIQKEHRLVYRKGLELMKQFPNPARVEAGEVSYDHWFAAHVKKGRIRTPLLERWKRSMKKRLRMGRAE
jgi:hypothetical protein